MMEIQDTAAKQFFAVLLVCWIGLVLNLLFDSMIVERGSFPLPLVTLPALLYLFFRAVRMGTPATGKRG